jgi:hypothetical protein
VIRVCVLGPAREAADPSTVPPAPGRPLPPDELGPAHVLVARALAAATARAESDVEVVAPLRVRGRMPLARDLLDPPTARQLLAWPRPDQRPDLTVVVLDADEDPKRREHVRAAVEALGVPVVVAAAAPELEAWMLADNRAVARVLGARLEAQAAPSKLAAGQARALLAAWCTAHAPRRDPREVRLEIARTCRLEVVSRRCRSMRRLIDDLRAALPATKTADDGAAVAPWPDEAPPAAGQDGASAGAGPWPGG